jgi:hypothetical protein
MGFPVGGCACLMVDVGRINHLKTEVTTAFN